MAIGLTDSARSAPKTVRDLLAKAFRIAHILAAGEGLPSADATDAFDLLNDLIEQANLDKLFALYQTEIVFPLVAGQIAYTIGPDTVSPPPNVLAVRPVEVLAAFSRRGNVDLPVRVTHQKEDYDRIQYKIASVSGWETLVYYQASYPAGTVYLYMKPADALTELHLTVMAQVTAFSGLTEELSLPPLYKSWMQYKLAQRLCPEYGLLFSDDNKAILLEVESTLKANNIKPFPISISDAAGLGMPNASAYNVFSDSTR